MKEMIIAPKLADNQIVVEFSDTYNIDKSVCVKVPNGVKAIVYVDGVATFRIEAGGKKVIYKEYGKDYLGKEIRVAFVKVKALPQLSWGFGNIQVNNERLKEAYRAGANGKYIIEVVDFVKLINSFVFGENITVENIKERTMSGVKTIGIPILSKCFANTNISVFEISSLIGVIRENIISALSDEKIFNNLGIKINTITVDGIHINEDDLELIRENING